MSKKVAAALVVVVLVLAVAGAASADDGPQYHRTTPRGSFGRDGAALLVGVPGGRAWGVESELRPLPDGPAALWATIEVRDASVREAFVRIAWYDRASGRSRQIALSDARAVRAGEGAKIELALDPPPTAIAYRVRVLARLRAPDLVSAAGAIRVSAFAIVPRSITYAETRLLP